MKTIGNTNQGYLIEVTSSEYKALKKLDTHCERVAAQGAPVQWRDAFSDEDMTGWLSAILAFVSTHQLLLDAKNTITKMLSSLDEGKEL